MITAIFLKLFKRKFVRNYKKFCKEKKGHALLFFKTDSFTLPSLARGYTHINFWEVLELCRIFNSLGYWVDIIDRTADIESLCLEDKYDLFVGISGGMSGKNWIQIAKKVPRAVKIAFVSSQRPDVYNAAIKRRYAYFYERHPDAKLQTIGMKEGIDMYEVAQHADAIFSEGDSFTLPQYRELGKPVHQIYVPSAPFIVLNAPDVTRRDQKHFLYFGSTRNVLKGLDILLDAFSEMPEYHLHICTPASEHDFNDFYAPLIKKSPNIHWEGFVYIGSEKFNQLTTQNGYVILLSCTDSMATSVTTCMRKGMIPITTPETDVHMGDFGYLMDDITIPSVQKKIRGIASIPRDEFVRRSIDSYLDSFKYTEESFSRCFQKALLQTITL